MLGLTVLACSMWPQSPAVALAGFEEMVVNVDTPYQHVAVVDDRNAPRVALQSLRGKRD